KEGRNKADGKRARRGSLDRRKAPPPPRQPRRDPKRRVRGPSTRWATRSRCWWPPTAPPPYFFSSPPGENSILPTLRLGSATAPLGAGSENLLLDLEPAQLAIESVHH